MALIATTAAGTLAGAADGGVSVFRNVPYAAPPVGPLRFAPPANVEPWSGVRNATRNGPVCPQLRSRLAAVMGDFEAEQNENCLSLTIWTPACDGAKRPVLVWLHGGAYSSGAGSLPWYSGRVLAERGDIVVVTVNYRLGALGYLYLPPVCEGNLGLLDQFAALRWVRENIEHFGGDPASITLGGQSAGAMSTAIIMSLPQSRGHIKRALLQSPALSRLARDAADAQSAGEDFARALGIDPGDADALRTVPVAQILSAQATVIKSRAQFADSSPLFIPVRDGTTIAHDVLNTLSASPAPDIDMLLGTTREESAAFCAIDPAIAAATPAQVSAVFEHFFGAHAARSEDEYRRRRPHADATAVLTDMLSDRHFTSDVLRLAAWRAQSGRPAYLYEFDWQSPAVTRFASCHCLELPFVFGTFDDFREAPMLAGAQRAELEALAAVMQDAWIAFVRTGSPDTPALPDWPAYELPQRTTMRFDRLCGPVADLAGTAYRPSLLA
jgi:para-nitrobenzyl esterase